MPGVSSKTKVVRKVDRGEVPIEGAATCRDWTVGISIETFAKRRYHGRLKLFRGSKSSPVRTSNCHLTGSPSLLLAAAYSGSCRA